MALVLSSRVILDFKFPETFTPTRKLSEQKTFLLIIFGQWAKTFLPIGGKKFTVIVKTAFYLTTVSFWGSFTHSNLYILEKFRLVKQKLHNFSTENFRQDGRHNLLLVLWKILMKFSLFYFFPIISENVLRFCWKSFPRDVKTAFYMSKNTKKTFWILFSTSREFFLNFCWKIIL